VIKLSQKRQAKQEVIYVLGSQEKNDKRYDYCYYQQDNNAQYNSANSRFLTGNDGKYIFFWHF